MQEMKRHENIYIRLPDSVVVLGDIAPSAGSDWYCGCTDKLMSTEARFSNKSETESGSTQKHVISLYKFNCTVGCHFTVYLVCKNMVQEKKNTNRININRTFVFPFL